MKLYEAVRIGLIIGAGAALFAGALAALSACVQDPPEDPEGDAKNWAEAMGMPTSFVVCDSSRPYWCDVSDAATRRVFPLICSGRGHCRLAASRR